jgi:hypothetical protein
MLISWRFECSTSWTPNRCTLMNFAHRVCVICCVSNYAVAGIIPQHGRQNCITSSLGSISTIPSRAVISYVKILEWVELYSTHGVPCLVQSIGIFQGIWQLSNKNPGALWRCTADIFSNIANGEMQRPGIPIAWRSGLVSLVGCTIDCQNCQYGRMLILRIQPLFIGVHLTVDLVTDRVCKAHQFKIVVCLKCEMCLKKLNSLENIPVVWCSKYRQMICNPPIIAVLKSNLREKLSQSICRLKWFDFEVDQSMP